MAGNFFHSESRAGYEVCSLTGLRDGGSGVVGCIARDGCGWGDVAAATTAVAIACSLAGR